MAATPAFAGYVGALHLRGAAHLPALLGCSRGKAKGLALLRLCGRGLAVSFSLAMAGCAGPSTSMRSAQGFALLRYAVLLAGVIAGVAILQHFVRYALRRRARPSELGPESWPAWDGLIGQLLAAQRRVTSDMLAAVPPKARALALRRYVEAHPEQALQLALDPPAIEPSRREELEAFCQHWATLTEGQLGARQAAPLTARIAEQLCALLGCAPIEQRSFNGLCGYMLRAPALPLSVPQRFPLVFLLQPTAHDALAGDLRDMMRVLNATSFFALLVVASVGAEGESRAAELRRSFRGRGQLVILSGDDLVSLYLATDPSRRLTELILDQVDLALVSPYVMAGPVSEGMFFGRERELKALLRAVRDRSFALVGGRKIGKTSVLTQAQRLLEQINGYAPYYMDCQYVASHDEFFEALSVACSEPVHTGSPDSLRRMLSRVRGRKGETLLVLLFDEVDSLLAYDSERDLRLFRVFRALSQEGLCRFVFCGERRLFDVVNDAHSPLFNFCSVARLGYLLPREARRMVQEPMAGLGVALEEPEALVEEIVDLSSCHPNLIQGICQMLLEAINARGERLVRREDLERVRASDAFREMLLEVTWGNANALERLITVLMVGEREFPAGAVQEALRGQGIRLSAAELEDALTSLELFSVLQREGLSYSFAVRAFPRTVIGARLREGLLEGLRERVLAEGPHAPV
ncbi:MAG: hypothetical protein FJZ90_05720 [Chloroflexi bacterium]|nr:hypothetical protein [Chloroflexota bacterium]